MVQRTESTLIVTVDDAEVGAAVAAHHLGMDRVPALVGTVPTGHTLERDTEP